MVYQASRLCRVAILSHQEGAEALRQELLSLSTAEQWLMVSDGSDPPGQVPAGEVFVVLADPGAAGVGAVGVGAVDAGALALGASGAAGLAPGAVAGGCAAAPTVSTIKAAAVGQVRKKRATKKRSACEDSTVSARARRRCSSVGICRRETRARLAMNVR